ncbi:DUF2058 family protein [Nitrincola tapanii]|uniref:DUF2058 domain-containing protein n=1 Tax=Nitrincola tapanii TaxID=1708751 RepID=A0A5A9W265_9GAMM|nr:DUF2058 family protein [Nitrincola tapanii]KAA0874198.1 DUF2058 domain-containing protein [Nitrincola tapanii]
MAGSLKDQLLKAGVASKQQAKKAQLDKRKQAKQKQIDPQQQAAAAAVEAARLAKAEKDRALNEARQAEQLERAKMAEIRQLAEQHQVTLPKQGEVKYNFVYENNVKSLWIDKSLQQQLSRQQLKIVALEGRFYLVPSDIADRILARNPKALVQDEAEHKARIAAEEAEYAGYEIPDDLDW